MGAGFRVSGFQVSTTEKLEPQEDFIQGSTPRYTEVKPQRSALNLCLYVFAPYNSVFICGCVRLITFPDLREQPSKLYEP